jgi:hypothetical protein
VRNRLGKPAVLAILSTGSVTCLHRDTYVRIDRPSEWIEAIAGVEDFAPAACGAVGELGMCSFANALGCRKGILEVTRCAGESVCGWNSALSSFGCIAASEDACRGAGSAGICQAEIARGCSGGALSEVSCGPCGRCAYEPATGLPRCYAR